MKIELLDKRLAGKILIVLCSGLIVFHICNLFGFIPLNITWLGRVESSLSGLLFGLLSIFINSVVIACAVAMCGFVNSQRLRALVQPVLPFVFWWLVGNTIANLFAKSMIEVVVFTPILIVLTICFYRIRKA